MIKACFADKEKLETDEYCRQNGIFYLNHYYYDEFPNKFLLLKEVFNPKKSNYKVILKKE